MNLFFKIVAPILALAGCAVAGVYLIKTAPEAKRRPSKPVVPSVEILKVKSGNYTVKVNSSGTVAPLTQSTIMAEVAGRIVHMSPNFRNGGFFEAGGVLARIDPAEYKLTIANLQASLQGVEARLAELAVSEGNLQKSFAIETKHMELTGRQYHRYKTLQKDGMVAESTLEQSEREYLLRQASLQNLKNDLQLVPAQRRTLESEHKLKQAQLDAAQLNLDRTEIHAPYSGRVLQKRVDLGQSVSKGSILGTIYAVDFIEVRLPVTDRQAAFLNLPKRYPGKTASKSSLPAVTLFATMGGKKIQWKGRILRSEGAIDTRTRQMFLVAQVDDPYSLSSKWRPALKIGQFVEAEIQGHKLTNVFILPRKAVRANDEVLTVTPDSRIARKPVDVAWRDEKNVVVRSGLRSGERISLTALPYAPDGAPVQVMGTDKKEPRGGKPLTQKKATQRSVQVWENKGSGRKKNK